MNNFLEEGDNLSPDTLECVNTGIMNGIKCLLTLNAIHGIIAANVPDFTLPTPINILSGVTVGGALGLSTGGLIKLGLNAYENLPSSLNEHDTGVAIYAGTFVLSYFMLDIAKNLSGDLLNTSHIKPLLTNNLKDISILTLGSITASAIGFGLNALHETLINAAFPEDAEIKAADFSYFSDSKDAVIQGMSWALMGAFSQNIIAKDLYTFPYGFLLGAIKAPIAVIYTNLAAQNYLIAEASRDQGTAA